VQAAGCGRLKNRSALALRGEKICSSTLRKMSAEMKKIDRSAKKQSTKCQRNLAHTIDRDPGGVSVWKISAKLPVSETTN
jgi:hypothetical protein